MVESKGICQDDILLARVEGLYVECLILNIDKWFLSCLRSKQRDKGATFPVAAASTSKSKPRLSFQIFNIILKV